MALTKLLILDVDGTLTDGGIILGETEDLRRFHAHDGVGIRLASLAGITVIFLSARENLAAARRARELGVRSLLGAARKDEHVAQLCRELNVTPAEAAFIGDDLQDFGAMKACGTAIAVANAVPEIRAIAHHVTVRNGGDGAVREAIEWLLRRDGSWDDVLARFLAASDFVVRRNA